MFGHVVCDGATLFVVPLSRFAVAEMPPHTTPTPTPTSLQTGPPSLPRGVALTTLVPLPALKTQCGPGYGLAACPTLGLLVTSDKETNTLSVWELPGGASGSGGASGGPGASAGAGAGGASVGGGGRLRLVCTLGGAGSVAPMRFKFEDGTGYSGYLAFTPPTTASRDSDSTHPLLLVTDHGHDAVHVVDVVGRTHAGYVASPGSIAGPRGVAATSSSDGTVLVAVSAWKDSGRGDHVVVVYRGSGAVWEKVRVIGGGLGAPASRDGQLKVPYGLRRPQIVYLITRFLSRESPSRVDFAGISGS